MQARWNGQVLASSDDIVTVEGNAYFPASALDPSFFRPSDHRTVCGWKGEAHYYDVLAGGEVNANAAWTYPEPKEAASAIAGRVAFWKGVQVA
ncbi:MAG: DUF427 domain-containing protein [Synechococcaceae cyanobacterium ELA182]